MRINKKIFCCVLILAILSIVCMGLVACGESEKGESPIESLVVTTLPKVEYYQGDAFDLGDAKLTVFKQDGSTSIVPITLTMISDFDSSVLGEQKLRVSYGNKDTYITVTVSVPPVYSVQVVKNPTKTVYTVGETLDVSGLVLKVIYSNNTVKTIELLNADGSLGTVSLSGNAATQENTEGIVALGSFSSQYTGSKKITLTYGGKNCTSDYVVVARVADNIQTRLTDDFKVNYVIGETFKLKGGSFYVHYNDNTSENLYWEDLYADGKLTYAVEGQGADNTFIKTTLPMGCTARIFYAGNSYTVSLTVSELKPKEVTMMTSPADQIQNGETDLDRAQVIVTYNTDESGFTARVKDGTALAALEDSRGTWTENYKKYFTKSGDEYTLASSTYSATAQYYYSLEADYADLWAERSLHLFIKTQNGYMKVAGAYTDTVYYIRSSQKIFDLSDAENVTVDWKDFDLTTVGTYPIEFYIGANSITLKYDIQVVSPSPIALEVTPSITDVYRDAVKQCYYVYQDDEINLSDWKYQVKLNNGKYDVLGGTSYEDVLTPSMMLNDVKDLKTENTGKRYLRFVFASGSGNLYCTVELEVRAKNIVSLTVREPNKVIYAEGETLALNGAQVKATYNNGTVGEWIDITADMLSDGTTVYALDSFTVEAGAVTVPLHFIDGKYQTSKDASFEILVVKKADSFALSTAVDTDYVKGNNFTYGKWEIIVNYSDGSYVTKTATDFSAREWNFVMVNEDGSYVTDTDGTYPSVLNFADVGEYTVRLCYGDIATTPIYTDVVCTVTNRVKTLTPNRTFVGFVTEGTYPSLSGLEVTAVRENGETSVFAPTSAQVVGYARAKAYVKPTDDYTVAAFASSLKDGWASVWYYFYVKNGSDYEKASSVFDEEETYYIPTENIYSLTVSYDGKDTGDAVYMAVVPQKLVSVTVKEMPKTEYTASESGPWDLSQLILLLSFDNDTTATVKGSALTLTTGSTYSFTLGNGAAYSVLFGKANGAETVGYTFDNIETDLGSAEFVERKMRFSVTDALTMTAQPTESFSVYCFKKIIDSVHVLFGQSDGAGGLNAFSNQMLYVNEGYSFYEKTDEGYVLLGGDKERKFVTDDSFADTAFSTLKKRADFVDYFYVAVEYADESVDYIKLSDLSSASAIVFGGFVPTKTGYQSVTFEYLLKKCSFTVQVRANKVRSLNVTVPDGGLTVIEGLNIADDDVTVTALMKDPDGRDLTESRVIDFQDVTCTYDPTAEITFTQKGSDGVYYKNETVSVSYQDSTEVDIALKILRKSVSEIAMHVIPKQVYAETSAVTSLQLTDNNGTVGSVLIRYNNGTNEIIRLDSARLQIDSKQFNTKMELENGSETSQTIDITFTDDNNNVKKTSYSVLICDRKYLSIEFEALNSERTYFYQYGTGEDAAPKFSVEYYKDYYDLGPTSCETYTVRYVNQNGVSQSEWPKEVGIYTLIVEYAGDAANNPFVSSDVYINIAKKQLGVQVDDFSLTYGNKCTGTADEIRSLTALGMHWTYKGVTNGILTDDAFAYDTDTPETVLDIAFRILDGKNKEMAFLTDSDTVPTYLVVSVSAGEYTVVPVLTLKTDNYEIPSSAVGEAVLTVVPRAVTVVAKDEYKYYGDNDPLFEFKVYDYLEDGYGTFLGGNYYELQDVSARIGETIPQGYYIKSGFLYQSATGVFEAEKEYYCMQSYLKPDAIFIDKAVSGYTLSRDVSDTENVTESHIIYRGYVSGAMTNYTVERYESAHLYISPVAVTVSGKDVSRDFGTAEATIDYYLSAGTLKYGQTFATELASYLNETERLYYNMTTKSVVPETDLPSLSSYDEWATLYRNITVEGMDTVVYDGSVYAVIPIALDAGSYQCEINPAVFAPVGNYTVSTAPFLFTVNKISATLDIASLIVYENSTVYDTRDNGFYSYFDFERELFLKTNIYGNPVTYSDTVFGFDVRSDIESDYAEWMKKLLLSVTYQTNGRYMLGNSYLDGYTLTKEKGTDTGIYRVMIGSNNSKNFSDFTLVSNYSSTQNYVSFFYAQMKRIFADLKAIDATDYETGAYVVILPSFIDLQYYNLTSGGLTEKYSKKNRSDWSLTTRYGLTEDGDRLALPETDSVTYAIASKDGSTAKVMNVGNYSASVTYNFFADVAKTNRFSTDYLYLGDTVMLTNDTVAAVIDYIFRGTVPSYSSDGTLLSGTEIKIKKDFDYTVEQKEIRIYTDARTEKVYTETIWPFNVRVDGQLETGDSLNFSFNVSVTLNASAETYAYTDTAVMNLNCYAPAKVAIGSAVPSDTYYEYNQLSGFALTKDATFSSIKTYYTLTNTVGSETNDVAILNSGVYNIALSDVGDNNYKVLNLSEAVSVYTVTPNRIPVLLLTEHQSVTANTVDFTFDMDYSGKSLQPIDNNWQRCEAEGASGTVTTYTTTTSYIPLSYYTIDGELVETVQQSPRALSVYPDDGNGIGSFPINVKRSDGDFDTVVGYDIVYRESTNFSLIFVYCKDGKYYECDEAHKYMLVVHPREVGLYNFDKVNTKSYDSADAQIGADSFSNLSVIGALNSDPISIDGIQFIFTRIDAEKSTYISDGGLRYTMVSDTDLSGAGVFKVRAIFSENYEILFKGNGVYSAEGDGKYGIYTINRVAISLQFNTGSETYVGRQYDGYGLTKADSSDYSGSLAEFGEETESYIYNGNAASVLDDKSQMYFKYVLNGYSTAYDGSYGTASASTSTTFALGGSATETAYGAGYYRFNFRGVFADAAGNKHMYADVNTDYKDWLNWNYYFVISNRPTVNGEADGIYRISARDVYLGIDGELPTKSTSYEYRITYDGTAHTQASMTEWLNQNGITTLYIYDEEKKQMVTMHDAGLTYQPYTLSVTNANTVTNVGDAAQTVGVGNIVAVNPNLNVVNSNISVSVKALEVELMLTFINTDANNDSTYTYGKTVRDNAIAFSFSVSDEQLDAFNRAIQDGNTYTANTLLEKIISYNNASFYLNDSDGNRVYTFNASSHYTVSYEYDSENDRYFLTSDSEYQTGKHYYSAKKVSFDSTKTAVDRTVYYRYVERYEPTSDTVAQADTVYVTFDYAFSPSGSITADTYYVYDGENYVLTEDKVFSGTENYYTVNTANAPAVGDTLTDAYYVWQSYYIPAEETYFATGTEYYTVSQASVTVGLNVRTDTYYELVGDRFVLTEDTVFVKAKTYYTVKTATVTAGNVIAPKYYQKDGDNYELFSGSNFSVGTEYFTFTETAYSTEARTTEHYYYYDATTDKYYRSSLYEGALDGDRVYYVAVNADLDAVRYAKYHTVFDRIASASGQQDSGKEYYTLVEFVNNKDGASEDYYRVGMLLSGFDYTVGDEVTGAVYERIFDNDTYALTTDTHYASGKTYYSLSAVTGLNVGDDVSSYYHVKEGFSTESGDFLMTDGVYYTARRMYAGTDYVQNTLIPSGAYYVKEKNENRYTVTTDLRFVPGTAYYVFTAAYGVLKDEDVGNYFIYNTSTYRNLKKLVGGVDYTVRDVLTDKSNTYVKKGVYYVRTEDSIYERNTDYYTFTSAVGYIAVSALGEYYIDSSASYSAEELILGVDYEVGDAVSGKVLSADKVVPTEDTVYADGKLYFEFTDGGFVNATECDLTELIRQNRLSESSYYVSASGYYYPEALVRGYDYQVGLHPDAIDQTLYVTDGNGRYTVTEDALFNASKTYYRMVAAQGYLAVSSLASYCVDGTAYASFLSLTAGVDYQIGDPVAVELYVSIGGRYKRTEDLVYADGIQYYVAEQGGYVTVGSLPDYYVSGVGAYSMTELTAGVNYSVGSSVTVSVYEYKYNRYVLSSDGIFVSGKKYYSFTDGGFIPYGSEDYYIDGADYYSFVRLTPMTDYTVGDAVHGDIYERNGAVYSKTADTLYLSDKEGYYIAVNEGLICKTGTDFDTYYVKGNQDFLMTELVAGIGYKVGEAVPERTYFCRGSDGRFEYTTDATYLAGRKYYYMSSNTEFIKTTEDTSLFYRNVDGLYSLRTQSGYSVGDAVQADTYVLHDEWYTLTEDTTYRKGILYFSLRAESGYIGYTDSKTRYVTDDSYYLTPSSDYVYGQSVGSDVYVLQEDGRAVSASGIYEKDTEYYTLQSGGYFFGKDDGTFYTRDASYVSFVKMTAGVDYSISSSIPSGVYLLKNGRYTAATGKYLGGTVYYRLVSDGYIPESEKNDFYVSGNGYYSPTLQTGYTVGAAFVGSVFRYTKDNEYVRATGVYGAGQYYTFSDGGYIRAGSRAEYYLRTNVMRTQKTVYNYYDNGNTVPTGTYIAKDGDYVLTEDEIFRYDTAYYYFVPMNNFPEDGLVDGYYVREAGFAEAVSLGAEQGETYYGIFEEDVYYDTVDYYTLTADASVVEGKQYFTLQPVAVEVGDSVIGYYVERETDEYSVTEQKECLSEEEEYFAFAPYYGTAGDPVPANIYEIALRYELTDDTVLAEGKVYYAFSDAQVTVGSTRTLDIYYEYNETYHYMKLTEDAVFGAKTYYLRTDASFRNAVVLDGCYERVNDYYLPTTDKTYQSGKKYYTFSADSMVELSESVLYYEEESEGVYVATEDRLFDTDKEYYFFRRVSTTAQKVSYSVYPSTNYTVGDAIVGNIYTKGSGSVYTKASGTYQSSTVYYLRSTYADTYTDGGSSFSQLPSGTYTTDVNASRMTASSNYNVTVVPTKFSVQKQTVTVVGFSRPYLNQNSSAYEYLLSEDTVDSSEVRALLRGDAGNGLFELLDSSEITSGVGDFYGKGYYVAISRQEVEKYNNHAGNNYQIVFEGVTVENGDTAHYVYLPLYIERVDIEVSVNLSSHVEYGVAIEEAELVSGLEFATFPTNAYLVAGEQVSVETAVKNTVLDVDGLITAIAASPYSAAMQELSLKYFFKTEQSDIAENYRLVYKEARFYIDKRKVHIRTTVISSANPNSFTVMYSDRNNLRYDESGSATGMESYLCYGIAIDTFTSAGVTYKNNDLRGQILEILNSAKVDGSGNIVYDSVTYSSVQVMLKALTRYVITTDDKRTETDYVAGSNYISLSDTWYKSSNYVLVSEVTPIHIYPEIESVGEYSASGQVLNIPSDVQTVYTDSVSVNYTNKEITGLGFYLRLNMSGLKNEDGSVDNTVQYYDTLTFSEAYPAYYVGMSYSRSVTLKYISGGTVDDVNKKITLGEDSVVTVQAIVEEVFFSGLTSQLVNKIVTGYFKVHLGTGHKTTGGGNVLTATDVATKDGTVLYNATGSAKIDYGKMYSAATSSYTLYNKDGTGDPSSLFTGNYDTVTVRIQAMPKTGAGRYSFTLTAFDDSEGKLDIIFTGGSSSGCTLRYYFKGDMFLATDHTTVQHGVTYYTATAASVSKTADITSDTYYLQNGIYTLAYGMTYEAGKYDYYTVTPAVGLIEGADLPVGKTYLVAFSEDLLVSGVYDVFDGKSHTVTVTLDRVGFLKELVYTSVRADEKNTYDYQPIAFGSMTTGATYYSFSEASPAVGTAISESVWNSEENEYEEQMLYYLRSGSSFIRPNTIYTQSGVQYYSVTSVTYTAETATALQSGQWYTVHAYDAGKEVYSYTTYEDTYSGAHMYYALVQVDSTLTYADDALNDGRQYAFSYVAGRYVFATSYTADKNVDNATEYDRKYALSDVSLFENGGLYNAGQTGIAYENLSVSVACYTVGLNAVSYYNAGGNNYLANVNIYPLNNGITNFSYLMTEQTAEDLASAISYAVGSIVYLPVSGSSSFIDMYDSSAGSGSEQKRMMLTSATYSDPLTGEIYMSSGLTEGLYLLEMSVAFRYQGNMTPIAIMKRQFLLNVQTAGKTQPNTVQHQVSGTPATMKVVSGAEPLNISASNPVRVTAPYGTDKYYLTDTALNGVKSAEFVFDVDFGISNQVSWFRIYMGTSSKDICYKQDESSHSGDSGLWVEVEKDKSDTVTTRFVGTAFMDDGTKYAYQRVVKWIDWTKGRNILKVDYLTQNSMDYSSDESDSLTQDQMYSGLVAVRLYQYYSVEDSVTHECTDVSELVFEMYFRKDEKLHEANTQGEETDLGDSLPVDIAHRLAHDAHYFGYGMNGASLTLYGQDLLSGGKTDTDFVCYNYENSIKNTESNFMSTTAAYGRGTVKSGNAVINTGLRYAENSGSISVYDDEDTYYMLADGYGIPYAYTGNSLYMTFSMQNEGDFQCLFAGSTPYLGYNSPSSTYITRARGCMLLYCSDSVRTDEKRLYFNFYKYNTEYIRQYVTLPNGLRLDDGKKHTVAVSVSEDVYTYIDEDDSDDVEGKVYLVKNKKAAEVFCDLDYFNHGYTAANGYATAGGEELYMQTNRNMAMTLGNAYDSSTGELNVEEKNFRIVTVSVDGYITYCVCPNMNLLSNVTDLNNQSSDMDSEFQEGSMIADKYFLNGCYYTALRSNVNMSVYDYLTYQR